MTTGSDPIDPLGLYPGIRACLFDMDGVITRTEVLHARAWKEAFDAFAEAWKAHTGVQIPPFGPEDYDRYVDGKRRLDGVRSFLASQDIELEEGRPDDPAGDLTVEGIGRAKNCIWLRLLDEQGVELEPGAGEYLEAVKARGLWCALVSSSANAAAVVERAGVARWFDVRVDGVLAHNLNLASKPAPDMFLEAARRLGVAPGAAAVFEDALAGVQAGRSGGFGLVVGISRESGRAAPLIASGADIVARTLAELTAGRIEERAG
jgi:beta-phosphoglucomutase family hydrolase